MGPGVLDRLFYGSCDHEQHPRVGKVPVLFTHHFRTIDEATGALIGASSDIQVERVGQLVTDAGQPFELRQPADDAALAPRRATRSSTSTH